MSDKERLAALSAQIASALEGAPRRPRLRLVTAADLPRKATPLYDEAERAWMLDRVRMWTRIYGLEQWQRQQIRGYFYLEDLPDDELASLLKKTEHGVQCIREGVGFDEAGLMD